MTTPKMNVNQVGYDRRLALVQSILDKHGLRSESVTPLAFSLQFPWPFNNFIYRVDLQAPATTANFPGAQPGTSPAPAAGVSTVVIRMGNLKVSDINHNTRTQNEVASTALAREALSAAGLPGLVPEIYAWQAPKSLEELEEEHFGWSICEFKSGKDLDAEFPSLSIEEQRQVILQLADIYAVLQKAVLPPGVDKVGGVSFADDGTMVSGQIATRKGGPWATLADFWNAKLQEIADSAADASFLKQSDQSDKKFFARLTIFLKEGGISKALEGVDVTQRCLIHGDLTMNNLLFDKKSKKITALIDFDFSSVNHPIEEHYFSSFSDVGGGLRSLSPAIYSCVMTDKFDAKPDELSEQDGKIWDTAQTWNAALVERDVIRPKTMPGVEKIEALRHFEDALGKMKQDEADFNKKYPQGDRKNDVNPVSFVADFLENNGY